MRLTPLFQRLSFRILTILLPLVFVVSGVQSAVAQTCPSGTEKNENNECVLNSAELRLRKALTLKDGTVLNCQRHRIVPDPNSPNAKPQVAIFLNNAKDIQIKNCRIFGFDFGVFVINSKQVPPSEPAPIKISHNKIQARYVAVSLMAVDNAEISRNDLKWLNRGGRAVYVGRNSDENRIINNFMHADLANTSKAFRAPGVEIPSNTAVTEGSAVLITETEGGEPALLTIIIDNSQIFQCGTTRCQEAISPGADLAEAPNTDGDFSQNNVVEGNTIKISGVRSVDGIVLAVPLGTRVGNNVIEGAKVSIRPGIQLGTKQFPGKCSSSGRFCLRGSTVADLNRDCNIPNFDPGGNTDQCPLGPAPANISWLSRDTVIQDNIIRLSTDTGISPAGSHTIITGNIVTGNGTGIGIRLTGKFPLEGETNPDTRTVVTRNTVRKVAAALSLIQIFPNPPPPAVDKAPLAVNFNARIFLNDFTDYNTAVLLLRTVPAALPPPFYDLTTAGLAFSELSENLNGNYWGIPCPLGFDETKVKTNSGTISSRARDSHPFGVPIVKAPPALPCH